MNASEAKALTEAAKSGELAAKKLLEAIYAKIRINCMRKADNALLNTYQSIFSGLSSAQINDAMQVIESDGYQVEMDGDSIWVKW